MPLITTWRFRPMCRGESFDRNRHFADQAGQAIKEMFRKQPVCTSRNLTPAEMAAANKRRDTGSLREATLAERTKEGHENWLITIGVCTHWAVCAWRERR